MKSLLPISAIVLGSLFALPVLALAEYTTVGGSANTETTVSSGGTGIVVTHEVVSPRDSASGMATGRRLNGLPPGTPVTGTLMTASGTKRMPSGMEIRNKMMASGTKPLPRGMEERIKERDDMMRASGTEMSNERGNEMRQKMMERKGEILKHMANQLLKVLHAAIARETKLADRIDARIIKMKAKGATTTEATAKVAIARAKIADATVAVDAAASAIDAAVNIQTNASASSSAGSDAGKPIREALTKAREAIKAAHQAIIDAINSLKGASTGKDDEHVTATGTASTGGGTGTTTH